MTQEPFLFRPGFVYSIDERSFLPYATENGVTFGLLLDKKGKTFFCSAEAAGIYPDAWLFLVQGDDNFYTFNPGAQESAFLSLSQTEDGFRSHRAYALFAGVLAAGIHVVRETPPSPQKETA